MGAIEARLATPPEDNLLTWARLISHSEHYSISPGIFDIGSPNSGHRNTSTSTLFVTEGIPFAVLHIRTDSRDLILFP